MATISEGTAAASVPSPRRRPFAALAERNYRLLLFGNGLSHAGDQMEWVARGWLVLQLTDSALALGLVQFVSGLPRLLLAMVAGVLADRLDRRQLLIISNIVNLVVATAFALLVFSDHVELWHVMVIVFITGSFSTLNMITRQALIPDVVSREHIGNALALHQSVRGTTQIVAQSLAGVLVAVIGVAGVLFINAASFLAMLASLLLMRIPPAPAPTERLGFRQDLALGVRFTWGRKDLFLQILLSLMPFLFIQPYRALLPIFARDVWQVGAAGYGLLMATPGAGALIAAAAIATFDPRRRGLIMLASLLVLSAALAAFALSPTFLLAVVLSVIVGVAFTVYRILNGTIIQLLTPREMMGRVMGIYHMDRGFLPAGSLLLGGLAALFGAPLAVALGATAGGLVTLALLVLRPSMRRL